MSTSRTIQSQPLNKSSSPNQKVSFNIPSQSQSISRISQITQNIHDPIQSKSRHQNNTSFQSRQLFNLINISTEDHKNTSNSFTKSPLMKTTSFIQDKIDSPLKRTLTSDINLTQQRSRHKKSLNQQSELSINPDLSENFSQEDIKFLKHPSPSFLVQHKGKTNKEIMNKGDLSFQSSQQEKPNKSARPSQGRESVDLSSSFKCSSAVVKKTNVRLSDQSSKRGEVKRNRNDVKETSYSTTSPCKDILSSQNKSQINNTSAQKTSITPRKQQPEIKGREPVSNRSSISHSQVGEHRKNQLSSNSVIVTKTKNSERKEGMDMKALLKEHIGFPESVTAPNFTSPKSVVPGLNISTHVQTQAQEGSPIKGVYNELLDKKYGSAQKKNSIFSAAKTIGDSPRNEKKEKNPIAIDDLYHHILDSIMTKMKQDPKKKPSSDVGSVDNNKLASNFSSNPEHIKSKSVSLNILNIMNQIPRGVLVKRADRKSSNNETDLSTDNKQQRSTKNQNSTFDLTKSFHIVKNMSLLTKNSPRPDDSYHKESYRKESGVFTDRSGSFLSPTKVHRKSVKKSKSFTIIRDEVKGLEIRTRKRSNAVVLSPFSPRGGRHPSSCERSLSVRPAKKEEKMDSKSLKVRKENKEFVDLINNISKNIQAPEIQELFGKDEEAIVKDLIDFIQAQESTSEEDKSGNNYQDRMTQLEKKLNNVRKIPSLQGLNFLGEEQKDVSPSIKGTENGSLRSLKSLQSGTTPTSRVNRANSMKKSYFQLESTKNSKKPLQINFGSVSAIYTKDYESEPMMSIAGLEVPHQLSNEPLTPKLGGSEPIKEEKAFFKESGVVKAQSKVIEEEKAHEITKNTGTRSRNVSLAKKQTSSQSTSKVAETLSPKKPNKGLLIDIPPCEPSNAETQESTLQSLSTPAASTKPFTPTLNSALHAAAATGHTKQEHQTTTPNIEMRRGSPPSLMNFTSPTAKNKGFSVPSPEKAPPSVRNSVHGASHLNINKFESFGNQPAQTEVEHHSPKNKHGALANMVFKAAQPTTPHTGHTDGTSHHQHHHLSISTIVNLKKKLKPVYIEKLEPENLKETIYEEILDKEHPGVSFGDIHDFFENAPFKKPVPAAQHQSHQPKKELTSLIPDSKRAQNISILAMKFRKLSMKEFREAIINLDPEIMTPDTCSTLLPFCPLPEEVKAFQNCKEPVEKLDAASQFMLNIYDIPQFGPRLRSTIFKHDFKERFDGVVEGINKIKVGCDILKANVHFKVFLRLSLEVANTLNEGTARGSALGLKPASLLSFDTVRSNKPGMTLLVYMAQKIYEQRPEILDFAGDFEGINEATKINIEDPIRGLQELKKDMNQIRLQLEVATEKNPPDTGFINAFKEFYDTSAPLLVEAEEKAINIKNYYVTTAKFLGEDDESLKKKTSMDFFKVFKHLGDTVGKFKTEEEAKKKREARRNATKK